MLACYSNYEIDVNKFQYCFYFAKYQEDQFGITLAPTKMADQWDSCDFSTKPAIIVSRYKNKRANAKRLTAQKFKDIISMLL